MTKNTRRAALAALFALGVSACGKPPPPPKPLPQPPSITLFESSSARIAAGQSTTLHFTAQNATSAEIVDGSGTPIAITGTASDGTATVTPKATALYVLKVTGDGGRDTAFVRVGVDEDLSEVFLAAVPAEVEAGQHAQLLWSAAHATVATISASTGETIDLDVTSDSGVIDVQPSRSASYTLSAIGADPTAAPLTAQAGVSVHGAIDAFTATPQGAHVGDTLTLDWTTRGLDQLTLTEAVFGELKMVTEPTEVDHGSFAFVIPATLPNGMPVSDGQPLHFRLTAQSTGTGETLSRTTQAWVGDAPAVSAFVVPEAVTQGKPVNVSWRAANAVSATLLVNGLPVFETLPSDPARATEGSFVLPPITEDLEVTLEVRSHAGAVASSVKHVAAVAPPVIDSFTVPQVVTAAGDPAAAAWTTHDASFLLVRPEGGPALFTTRDGKLVADGSAELYPSANTTLVLEAYNAAGDSVTATKSVQVSMAAQATATPSPVVPGTAVNVGWQLDPAITADVVGIPSPTPVHDTMGPDWVDLDNHVEAKQVVFDDPNDGIAALDLPLPFRFPFIGALHDTFFVSTNGFVSFSDVGARPTNEDLTVAGTPEVLAPFWDDLSVGTGKVLYVVDDSVKPRRLIIEWSGVSTTVDPASQLTFEVQLLENGVFRFLYKTLQGTDASAANATVGVRAAQDLFSAQLGYNFGSALIAENDEFRWFTGGPLSGSVTFAPQQVSDFGFFSRLQSGAYMWHALPVWVFGPGSLVVTEAMADPGPAATQGHWIELYNAQPVAVDVGGVELITTTSPAPYVLSHRMVPAKSFVVYGDSTDLTQNGGAPVDEAWMGLTPASDDTATVQLMATPLSTLAWTAATPGTSVQAPERAIDAMGAPLTCTRTKTFGGGALIGTPGAANEVCFEYTLTQIPGAFEDLSADGTDLLPTASDYNGTGTFPLEVAFPYFGQPQTSVNLSMVGFATFGPPLTSAYDLTNDTTPGSPAPNGVVAPFWDQLVRNINGHLYMARRSNYTVISWQDYRIFGATSSLNFEVKLFDDGAIEFHYGTMTPPTGTYADRATGSSATTWIERLDGSGALPVNINTANGIQPNSGWRFTPNF